jgi:valyl-tRNA synthetase
LAPFLGRLDAEASRVVAETEPPEKSVTVVSGEFVAYLPLAGMVDLEAERQRLAKEMDQVRKAIGRSEALLANEGFTKRAPEEVVQREREKLAGLKEKAEKLQEHLRLLEG